MKKPMRKQIKRKKIKEKKLESLEEINPNEAAEKKPEKSLGDLIKEASDGLFYISESDAEIKLFVGRQAASVSRTTVLEQANLAADTPIEERTFADFFAHLIEVQEWFGEEEIATAKKFVELKEILERNIRELKVFKCGKVQLIIYVVGLDATNTLIGIKTEAVET